MKKILEKIKLIDYLDTQLEIQKSDFTNRLKNIVDEGSTNSFSDIFSSSKNEFKGEVDFSEFKIKRKRKLFEINFNFPIAKGSFNQKGNILFIKTEINAFNGIIIFFFIFVLLIYIVIFFSIFQNTNDDSLSTLAILPLLLIHASFMIGIPYLFLRGSVKRFKYNFERELFYLTKNSNTHPHL